MPPEENSVQDTEKQDAVVAEPVVGEAESASGDAPAPVAEENGVGEPVPVVEEQSLGEDVQVSSPPPVTEGQTPITVTEEMRAESATPVQQNIPPPQQTAPATPTTALRGDIVKARAKIQEKKRGRLDKILMQLEKKGRITNDEVEKLLHISDATATRYLETLERENRIRQVGKTGRGVFYEKI